MTVNDENVEKEQAKQVTSQLSKKRQQVQQRLEQGKEVTNKELKKMVKEYEKQEQKREKEPDVLSETKYTVDSMAYKKYSVFWADIRPAQLNKEEKRGYKKTDNQSEVQRKADEG